MVRDKVLFSFKAFVETLERADKVFLITDHTVESLYGKEFISSLGRGDLPLFSFAPGEASKMRKTRDALEDFLLDSGADRKTMLIALGGGVVTDLVGFVASTYMRGIAYVSVPTTLMAMADAAIGGKTGINHPLVKNLLGAIYPPEAVYIDKNFLNSLSKKEKMAGWLEIIKISLVLKESLFTKIEKGGAGLESILKEAILLKKKVVREDPYDKGIRLLLNFGHTWAHALEALYKFTISHGEALQVGLLAESYHSYRSGIFPLEELERVIALIERFNEPFLSLENIDPHLLYKEIERDKKGINGIPRVIMLEKIGRGIYNTPLSFDDVKETLAWLQSGLLQNSAQ
jgi:3-dehydroquinate synthase